MDIKNALADPFAFLRQQQQQAVQARQGEKQEAGDEPPAGRSPEPELLPTREERSEAAGNVWHRIAERYDVRRLSEQDRREIARELYEAGAIDRMDQARLSYSAVPEGMAADTGAASLTEPDDAGRLDFLAETQARLTRFGEQDRQYGLGQRRVLEILNRIEAARAGPLSVSI